MPAAAPSVAYALEAKAVHEGDGRWDPMADKRLWTGVILQAVQDAMVDAHEPEWTNPQRDAHDAIKWLLYPTSEFRFVCAAAGANAAYIQAQALKKLLPYADAYEVKADQWLDTAAREREGSADQKAALKTAERYQASAKLIRGAS